MSPQQPESRECPFCKEEVKATAVRCRHCQAALVPTRPDHGGECPFCKEAINVEAIRCKHCLADLGGVRGMIIYGSEGFSASARGSLEERGIIVVGGRPSPDALSAGSDRGIVIHFRDPSRNAIIIHA
jgi:hypothetical protein